ncbi:MAG TPA: hypothetical protein VN809_14780 [Telmatospirillum sp.]|nr:hypothetical protein [Telmatospirillum sp.]
MVRLRGLCVMVVVALSLSACARVSWVKPNAGAAEWEQTKAACMLEGAQRVPVAPAYAMQPGSSYTSTNCDNKGHNCTTYDTVTPPSVQQYDANAGLRDQVVKACFYRNGWTEKVE